MLLSCRSQVKLCCFRGASPDFLGPSLLGGGRMLCLMGQQPLGKGCVRGSECVSSSLITGAQELKAPEHVTPRKLKATAGEEALSGAPGGASQVQERVGCCQEVVGRGHYANPASRGEGQTSVTCLAPALCWEPRQKWDMSGWQSDSPQKRPCPDPRKLPFRQRISGTIWVHPARARGSSQGSGEGGGGGTDWRLEKVGGRSSSSPEGSAASPPP